MVSVKESSGRWGGNSLISKLKALNQKGDCLLSRLTFTEGGIGRHTFLLNVFLRVSTADFRVSL